MLINYPIYKKISVRDYLESFYLSKSKIYTLFLENNILLNNHKVKENDIMNEGDTLSINIEEQLDYVCALHGNIDIIYEDDYLLVINKKPNILIHDEKNKDNSLCNLVSKYYYENGISLNIRFAHRLDIETSGLIIFCKDILTHAYFNHYISTHDIKREYICLVSNKFKNKKGTIDFKIGRDRHENKMRISSTGKEARTFYEVIKEYKDYTSVRVFLETGRTHQIRVHMNKINHPLLGDELYDGDMTFINRVALHSNSVTFIHPVYNEKMTLTASMPKDMKDLMK
ncbi:MAG: RluA family pseudouridine synthase [Acholeplasmatales bacterium]|nr:RluA family pseudouridine synthase [Acholeplasmatales bacterium]